MTSVASDVTLPQPDKAFLCIVLRGLLLLTEQIAEEFLIAIRQFRVMPSWLLTNSLISIFVHVKLANSLISILFCSCKTGNLKNSGDFLPLTIRTCKNDVTISRNMYGGSKKRILNKFFVRQTLQENICHSSVVSNSSQFVDVWY